MFEIVNATKCEWNVRYFATVQVSILVWLGWITRLNQNLKKFRDNYDESNWNWLNRWHPKWETISYRMVITMKIWKIRQENLWDLNWYYLRNIRYHHQSSLFYYCIVLLLSLLFIFRREKPICSYYFICCSIFLNLNLPIPMIKNSLSSKTNILFYWNDQAAKIQMEDLHHHLWKNHELFQTKPVHW